MLPSGSCQKLVVSGLTKRYRSVCAVDGFSAGFDVGLVGLVGPNGAGKTTLLRMLATVLVPDEGRFTVAGVDPCDDLVAVRRSLTYLPQQLAFYDHFSAFEFLDYVALLRGIPSGERFDGVVRALERVNLADERDKKVGKLSGGMRRRLGIAVALLDQPGLVLLDEPFAGLDPHERISLVRVLAVAARTATVIVSTHQTDDVEASFDRVVVLDHGRVGFDGLPGELAGRAEGCVWLGPETDESLIEWPQSDGRFRHVGSPLPVGRDTVAPTMDDGYLMVLDETGS